MGRPRPDIPLPLPLDLVRESGRLLRHLEQTLADLAEFTASLREQVDTDQGDTRV